MRNIGGELELKFSNVESYFTDSGRSSLRFFLRTSINKNKKYLLPDFFCEVIERIFIDENIEYSFYKIDNKLLFDERELLNKDFDVLYVINYFGMQTSIESSVLKNKIIIEDNVFFHNFENVLKYKHWFAFNSFRKVSQLSGGSLIKTNLDLDEDLISNKNAPFVKVKNVAKNIKYEYLNNTLFTEQEYLDKLKEAEDDLDKQKNIFNIDNGLISNLISMDINIQQIIRKRRFEILYSLFPQECINKKPSYYSFFILLVKNRNKLREKLMRDNIYLPIHWPKSSVSNELYNKIISIPLFEIYTKQEFLYLIEKIKGAL